MGWYHCHMAIAVSLAHKSQQYELRHVDSIVHSSNDVRVSVWI